MAALKEHRIATIELLVINLYPFAQTIARADCSLEQAIENIDIGGPAMLRAAAKNWQDVTVVIDPADYAQVLSELDAGELTRATKFAFAKKVFAHTARYDGLIANYLSSLTPGAENQPHQAPTREPYPQVFNLQVAKTQALRYGENPHQSAAFYREREPAPGTLAQWTQIQGKELSYNNIADADAAWECVKRFSEPACVIVKHANPCGAATGDKLAAAYEKAFKTDPTSAFGGILAFNRAVDGATATAFARQFAEVIVAPRFEPDALGALAKKDNLRLIEVPLAHDVQKYDYQRIGGGLLVQSSDAARDEKLKVVIKQLTSNVTQSRRLPSVGPYSTAVTPASFL
jgi:phosphoribosylaminoimidazolecarboxamide formyltransferase/IMP cyclohydrolase